MAGSSGCGKTSLIFTLARGLFPDPDWVPGRFDGKGTGAFGENTANLEAFFWSTQTLICEQVRQTLFVH